MYTHTWFTSPVPSSFRANPPCGYFLSSTLRKGSFPLGWPLLKTLGFKRNFALHPPMWSPSWLPGATLPGSQTWVCLCLVCLPASQFSSSSFKVPSIYLYSGIFTMRDEASLISLVPKILKSTVNSVIFALRSQPYVLKEEGEVSLYLFT